MSGGAIAPDSLKFAVNLLIILFNRIPASIERLGLANLQSPIVGNRVRVRDINLCANPSQVNEKSELENFESIIKETPTDVNGKSNNIETSLRLAKQETIRRLVKVGLTAEQIALWRKYRKRCDNSGKR